uniref:Uncharacterized protein n=1 Tax=Tetranychus urticae TaxID=32264 RepID=T1JZW4_TETUR
MHLKPKNVHLHSSCTDHYLQDLNLKPESTIYHDPHFSHFKEGKKD